MIWLKFWTKWLQIKNKIFYYIMSSAEDTATVMNCTPECLRGLAACLKGSTESGVIHKKGVCEAGAIRDKKAMSKACEMGKSME